MIKVGLLTREYPPDIYGGAGVHVEYLARELRQRVDLQVQCWGEPRREAGVVAHQPWKAVDQPKPEAGALQAISIDLAMAASAKGRELVHSHTWYANLGGHMAKLAWGIPHVVTTHSLEPLRPWKAEQLGGGYALSCWCEKTAIEAADAVIAVSEQMRRDVLQCYPATDPERVWVIHNGIDPDDFHPVRDESALRRMGVDPDRPYALFVGRITRQKGVPQLLAAAPRIDPSFQLVLSAGAPDTPEIEREVNHLREQVQAERGGLVWIPEMLPREDLISLYSGATVFICPSVYEPFGLVNLEAMACETAVVATEVGGIPEIVVEGETGFLVKPDDPAAMADRVNRLLHDLPLAERMGRAGRRRVQDRFSWKAIADRTVELYESLLA